MHPDGIISNKKKGGGINKEMKQAAVQTGPSNPILKKSTIDFSDEADQPCSWTVKTKQFKRNKGEEKRRQQRKKKEKKNGTKTGAKMITLSIL